MQTPYEMAKTLARIAHDGQVDKSGDPVFDHVERVVSKVEFPGEATVAYLHDIVEDTVVTEDDLHVYFDEWVVLDVTALTRKNDETYMDYIERIIRNGSPAAVHVKLADLEDHLDRKSALSDSMIHRYERARKRLLPFSETYYS